MRICFNDQWKAIFFVHQSSIDFAFSNSKKFQKKKTYTHNKTKHVREISRISNDSSKKIDEDGKKKMVGSNDLGCEEGEKVEKMGKEGGFSRFVGDD